MLLVSILYVPLYRNYLFMDQLYYIIGTIDISMVPKMFVASSLVEKLYHLPQLYRYLDGTYERNDWIILTTSRSFYVKNLKVNEVSQIN